MPKIALINIGTELLKGKTVNTNASDVGKMLKEEGYALDQTIVIHDEGKVIEETLARMLQTQDILIITGGLGPTKDDITKHVLNDFFGGEMIIHAPSLDRIKEWYRTRGRKMNDIISQQALVPSSCEVLENTVGTAPGMLFKQGERLIFSLPGVPQEMRYLIENEVIPRIKARYASALLPTFALRTFGVPESDIAIRVAKLEAQIPNGIELGFYPSHGHVKIEITGGPAESDAAQKVLELLKNEFSDTVFSETEATLESVLGEVLKAKELTLGFAESCTGGSLAAAITSVSGASNYFKGSIVTYATEAKINLLGVPEEIVEAHTVVSAEVAMAMAKGARSQLKTDIAVSVTGAAEVYPGDPVYGEPVIWIGYSDEQGEIAEKHYFRQDRASNIKRAVKTALFTTLKKVRQNFG